MELRNRLPKEPTIKRPGATRELPVQVLRSATQCQHVYRKETDLAEFLYKPHTITAGGILVTVIALLYSQFYLADDSAASIKLGLVAALTTFVFFGAIHFPDGLLKRPHPVVWRIFLAFQVPYLCLLVFLLFVDLSTARSIVAFLDPKLRGRLPEKAYADDCRLSTPDDPYKFWNTICDEFIIAHLIGYFAKMLIIRDWRICTAISFLFEVVEISLQHILPNFKECWWDHVIFDICICNAGGTILGALTLRLLSAKHYNWVKLEDIPSISGKIKRIVSQAFPSQVDPYEWQLFRSPRRFFYVSVVIILVLVQELNCFTSKNILQIPSTHPIVIARLTLWGFSSIPAMRDTFEFVSNPRCQRLGTAAWVSILILLGECLVISKYTVEGGFFTQPMPAFVGLPLAAAFAIFFLWIIFYFYVPFLRRWMLTRMVLNGMFYSVIGILFFMCLMANVDLQFKQAEFMALVRKYDLW